MEINKTDSRFGYKKHGIETSFVLFPTLIYTRYTNNVRVILFSWLWFVLTARLSDYRENCIILKYKCVADTNEK